MNENVYFQAAQAIGSSRWRSLLRQVLPNVLAPIIFSINVGGVIMSEAALSRVAGTYVIVLLYVRHCAILSAMAAISATRLRQNLYNILDSVVDTGVPVEVERRGRLLRIVPEERASKWNRLTAHKIVVGDPDELVHADWSHEWRGNRVP